MAEIHVVRYSNNPQIKSFQQTELPSRFWAPGGDGRETEFYFLNSYGEVENFVIPKGGSMKMNTSDAPYIQHNYLSLLAYLRRPEACPPGSEFKVVNLEDEASNNVSKRSMRVKAIVRIEEQKSDKGFVASLARRLGLAKVTMLSDTEVLDFVQAQADESPVEMLAILDSVYQTELFEIDKALEASIMRQQNGFYYYGSTQLGVSEGAVIDYFHRFPDVLADIMRRNAAVYGGMAAQDQKRRIQEAMAAAAAPVLAQTNSSILDATAPTQAEVAEEYSSATYDLLARARAKGIIVEYEDDNNSLQLAFSHIPLTVASGPADYVKQALAFLSLPANKAVRKQVESATAQAERTDKAQLATA